MSSKRNSLACVICLSVFVGLSIYYQSTQITLSNNNTSQAILMADKSASRVQELEKRLDITGKELVNFANELQGLRIISRLNGITIRAQGAYVQQLRAFIKSHDLLVPQFDTKTLRPINKFPQHSDLSLPSAPNINEKQ